MTKKEIEKIISQLENEKNEIIIQIGELECKNCVDLTSRYTNTDNGGNDDAYLHEGLEYAYRELQAKLDRYKKQLKTLSA